MVVVGVGAGVVVLMVVGVNITSIAGITVVTYITSVARGTGDTVALGK